MVLPWRWLLERTAELSVRRCSPYPTVGGQVVRLCSRSDGQSCELIASAAAGRITGAVQHLQSEIALSAALRRCSWSPEYRVRHCERLEAGSVALRIECAVLGKLMEAREPSWSLRPVAREGCHRMRQDLGRGVAQNNIREGCSLHSCRASCRSPSCARDHRSFGRKVRRMG